MHRPLSKNEAVTVIICLLLAGTVPEAHSTGSATESRALISHIIRSFLPETEAPGLLAGLLADGLIASGTRDQ